MYDKKQIHNQYFQSQEWVYSPFLKIHLIKKGFLQGKIEKQNPGRYIMINEENLNKLYQDVLEGVPLTTKELNAFGFNFKDLNDLIEKGSIMRVKRGLYALASVEGMLYYGKRLIAQKEYDKATQCFQKCHEIDPTHKGVCFQLFLKSVQNKDYTKAFEYFDVFYESDNAFYNADSNFYLYMLSMITELPENHRQYAKYLQFQDFKVDLNDKRYENIHLQNKIRISASKQRFNLAIKQLNEAIQEKESLSVQDILTQTLLLQAIEVQQQNRKNVVSLIQQEKYEDIVTLYNRISSFRHLSQAENYTALLTKDLLNMLKTKCIPQKRVINPKTLQEAINGKNYELALSLIPANEKTRENYLIYRNPTYILLNEIVNKSKELEERIKKEKQTPPAATAKRTIQPLEKSPVIETEASEKSSNETFVDMMQFLMNGDVDNTLKTLRVYLNSINKTDYEFLIIDLIKISLLKKDTAFIDPMVILTLMRSENYSFDISTYIQAFYIQIAKNNFEEARIYLDIIFKGNKLSQDGVILDSLYQVLKAKENRKDYKEGDTVLNIVDETLEDRNTKFLNKQQTSQVQMQYETPSKEKITEEESNLEKKLMNKNYIRRFRQKGVILLKPMKRERIDRIIEMVENYKDKVAAFVIGEGNKQQVVLRYKPKINEYVDVTNLIHLGSQAYKEGNYKECIENYLQLLRFFEEPQAYIYSGLGLSYLHRRKISRAIDYLTIANDLVKKENLDLDYSDLIAVLKGDIPEEDRKPYFRMTQEDFDYNGVSQYYGIDNFVEINSFIIESGLDVETACEQIGLSLEQTDLVKLIYAREFYMQGNYKKGDLFLKSFERSKAKTENTKRIFEEVQVNKKFYQYRKKDTQTQLVLSLVPKKK